jgi:hypothetical protein
MTVFQPLDMDARHRLRPSHTFTRTVHSADSHTVVTVEKMKIKGEDLHVLAVSRLYVRFNPSAGFAVSPRPFSLHLPCSSCSRVALCVYFKIANNKNEEEKKKKGRGSPWAMGHMAQCPKWQSKQQAGSFMHVQMQVCVCVCVELAVVLIILQHHEMHKVCILLFCHSHTGQSQSTQHTPHAGRRNPPAGNVQRQQLLKTMIRPPRFGGSVTKP